jgi:hypothetical protein
MVVMYRGLKNEDIWHKLSPLINQPLGCVINQGQIAASQLKTRTQTYSLPR